MNKKGKSKYRLLEEFDDAARRLGANPESILNQELYRDAKERLKKRLDTLSKQIQRAKIREAMRHK